MRGKLVIPYFERNFNRITPADAGKTNTVAVTCAVKRDHPRGCGENLLKLHVAGEFKGSPPRMRGKQVFSNFFVSLLGITPADAGKTNNQLPQDYIR